MSRNILTIEQTGSPIRRHRSQRATLIGLGLNRIGRVAELADTPASRGMIAKVNHLVRIVQVATELDSFFEAVRTEYHEVVAGPASRITRGGALWERFEASVTAWRNDPNASEAAIIECVNELAVAKLLAEDPYITGRITYEPEFLPDGRKIDFVVDRGDDNIYVEVKTVRPRTVDDNEAWKKFQKRKQFHPKNVNYIVSREWMGGAIYGNSFTARSRFLEYTQEFEERLAAAKAIKPGPGVLIFCGNEFAWQRSSLEDFADFYHSGVHRRDDAFGRMELHHIKEENIVLKRNIDHFGFLKRHFEQAKRADFYWPVRGPAFGR